MPKPNQTYEISQEYKLNEKPILCQSGFHYCKNAQDTLTYYAYTHEFKLLEIEDLSNDTITEGLKSCSNYIKIIREITDPEELLQLLGCYSTYDENGNQLNYKNSYNSILSQPKDYDFTLTNNLFYLPYIPLKNQQSFLYP